LLQNREGFGIAIAETLRASLERLESTGDYNHSIAKVLLTHARRKHAKYSLMDKNFQRKYGMSFAEFADSEVMREPTFEVEQDFFDWDMTVTGMEDMQEEIERLGEIVTSQTYRAKA
jgi:hypothetical protein